MTVIMQLRKCCNHPYMFEGAEPQFDGEYKLGDHLIENSGKLWLLDKLFPKLQAEVKKQTKQQGHKVLVFSQMTRMLDIVQVSLLSHKQDYLHYRQYAYERLDGSVRGDERFLAIKEFNEVPLC